MEPQHRLVRNTVILSCVITVLLIGAVIASHRAGLLEKPDLFLYDLYFRWKGPEAPSGNTVLVLMDQKSAAELERRKGAWSRLQIAAAIENLSRAGASVIGLDFVFFAPSEIQEEDRALAAALHQCGNVVLAKYVANEGKAEISSLPLFQAGMLGEGFINMFPDRDGVVRRMPFFSARPEPEGVAISPCFSLEVVRGFLNLDFAVDFSGSKSFRLGGEVPAALVLPYPDLRLYFYGGPGAFQRFSFSDVVLNRFSPETVNGKIILMGSGLTGDKDFFRTPFSSPAGEKDEYQQRFGRVVEVSRAGMEGVAVHAMAVETMLNRAFIRRLPGTYIAGGTILLGILGLLLYLQRSAALGGLLGLTGACGTLLFAASYLFTRHLLWVEIAAPLIALAIQYVAGIAVQRSYNRKKNRMITSLFGKYVSRRVVSDIVKGNISVSLEGTAKEVTVLFSDLRGFTTLSEGLTPQETGRLLNTYFDAMIPIIFDCEGTLNKLMGDAIMAFFGAPGELKDHPEKAAEAAIRMIRRLAELKEARSEKGIEKLAVGIGLNTGIVTVGNLGSQHFMDYTVIGDSVNLGSRLEGLNKVYGTSILISEYTACRLSSRFAVRELDRVRVKGKSDAVGVYELAGLMDDMDPERRALLRRFETGLELYWKRDWREAREVMEEVLHDLPQDGPATLYRKRLADLLANPPGQEWDPVTTFTAK